MQVKFRMSVMEAFPTRSPLSRWATPKAEIFGCVVVLLFILLSIACTQARDHTLLKYCRRGAIVMLVRSVHGMSVTLLVTLHTLFLSRSEKLLARQGQLWPEPALVLLLLSPLIRKWPFQAPVWPEPVLLLLLI